MRKKMLYPIVTGLLCAVLLGCGEDGGPTPTTQSSATTKNPTATSTVSKSLQNNKAFQAAIGGPKRGGWPVHHANAKFKHLANLPSDCWEEGDGTFFEFDPEDTSYTSGILRQFDTGYGIDSGGCKPNPAANILGKGRLKLITTPTPGTEPKTGSCGLGLNFTPATTAGYSADPDGVTGTVTPGSLSVKYGEGFGTIGNETAATTPSPKYGEDVFRTVFDSRGTDDRDDDDLDLTYGRTVWEENGKQVAEDYCEFWDSNAALNTVAGKFQGVEYSDKGTTVVSSSAFEYKVTKDTFTPLANDNFKWEIAFDETGTTCYSSSKTCTDSTPGDKDKWLVTYSWKFDSSTDVTTVTTVLTQTYSDGFKLAKITFNEAGVGKSSNTSDSGLLDPQGNKVGDVEFKPQSNGSYTITITYPDGSKDVFTA